jgi:GntR family transcriptional regulator/MocR family aminotransferase
VDRKSMRREPMDLSFLHSVIARRPRRLARAVATTLRQALFEGRVPDGARLPSTRSLAREFAISRNVAIEAYAMLEAEGLLAPNRGGGTTVVRPERERVRSSKRRAALDFAHIPAPILDDRIDGQEVFLPPCVPDATFLRETWRVSWRWASTRPESGDYGNPSGELFLRQEIARHLAAVRSMKVDAEQVVITNGALEAVRLVARVLVKRPAWIAVENPGWAVARQALRQDGHDVRTAPVDLHGLDVTRLFATRRPPRLVLVTPAHQFPLGGRLPIDRRLSLLNRAEANSAWLAEDDYDGEFRFDVPPLPALVALARSDRVIYIGSFSKTLTPQLRIGYLVGSPAIVEQITRLKAFANYHAPRMEQLAIARFMAEGFYDRHLTRMRRIYAERRQMLAAALTPSPASVAGIEGGLHVYWRFPSRHAAWQANSELKKSDIHLPMIAQYSEGRLPWHGFAVGFAKAGAERLIERLAIVVRNLG